MSDSPARDALDRVGYAIKRVEDQRDQAIVIAQHALLAGGVDPWQALTRIALLDPEDAQ